MFRFVTYFLVCIFLIAGWAEPTSAAKRVALVIGNSAYEHASPLKNPKNDAEAMAKALELFGFEVVSGIDLKHRDLAKIISQFRRKLSGADVGLFFYAGHGLQVKGLNYLAPVDAKLDEETSLAFEAVPLQLILNLMENSSKTNLVFLDACRDNPLARNLARSMGTRSNAIGRGLAREETGLGTLISFATQPGNVALDGEGGHSPFATGLLKHIETPGMDVALVLRRVRQDVINMTSGSQVPWSNSSLTGSFVFNEKSNAPTTESASASRATPSTQSNSVSVNQSVLAAYEATKEISSCGAYKAFEAAHPASFYAKLSYEWRQKNCEAKVASLSKPSTVETEPLADPAELTRALQKELKRVGCDPGNIDGQWGHKGRNALSLFNKHTKLTLQTDQPTSGAVDAVKSKTTRVCRSPVVKLRPKPNLITKVKKIKKKPVQTRSKRCATWHTCDESFSEANHCHNHNPCHAE